VITRPLDLASHLTAPQRGWDPLFYVNVGLLALFFSFFGSRFILSPVVALMSTPAAQTEEASTTHFITVRASGPIITPAGLLSLDQLGRWLRAQAKTTDNPSLLVRASADVTLTDLSEIINTAQKAGFKVMLAVEPSAAK
jgi:biopolymer transport protein ExbD